MFKEPSIQKINLYLRVCKLSIAQKVLYSGKGFFRLLKCSFKNCSFKGSFGNTKGSSLAILYFFISVHLTNF